jgi:CRISPR/Cas system-associated protein endoribonuclease Cas2
MINDKRMKYLKVFENFDYDTLEDEVKDLAEQSLAYLLDDGWQIETNLYNNYVHGLGSNNDKILMLHIEPPHTEFYEVSWDEIKDRVIPFFQLLERRYKLKDISNNRSGRPYLVFDEHLNRLDYSLKYLCSDTRQDFLISKISIVVEGRK